MATGASARRTTGAVAPARACAFAVIRRVFEHGAYADRALHAEAAGLDRRDRALATALAYGTVQRRATLDHVAAELSSRALARLDPPVLAALRLGLFQILLLGGIADHAAVNDTVELAKRAGGGGAGLVNAVLRRATREGQALLDALDDDVPERAAVLHSVPVWLARRWWVQLGADDARALLRRVNEPAESAVRVNTLVAGVDEAREALRTATGALPAAAEALPEGLVLSVPFDAHGSELFGRGAIMPQSRGSMLVGRVLAPEPGASVLDLCAAPGAKTTHLAALMGDEGSITAVERNTRRAQTLAESCARMHAECVSVHVADAARWDARVRHGHVLVDPPCSGLGTLQSRPDLRWRVKEESIAELSAVQGAILAAAAECTAPGGTLVYSVCTISRAEGEEVVEAFLRARPEFSAENLHDDYPQWRTGEAGPYLQLLPHRDRTDGFFIARIRRR